MDLLVFWHRNCLHLKVEFNKNGLLHDVWDSVKPLNLLLDANLSNMYSRLMLLWSESIERFIMNSVVLYILSSMCDVMNWKRTKVYKHTHDVQTECIICERFSETCDYSLINLGQSKCLQWIHNMFELVHLERKAIYDWYPVKDLE